MGCSPWGHKELDTTEATKHTCTPTRGETDDEKIRNVDDGGGEEQVRALGSSRACRLQHILGPLGEVEGAPGATLQSRGLRGVVLTSWGRRRAPVCGTR